MRSRAGSGLPADEAPILSNSPQVTRLLRQPRAKTEEASVPSVFTVDPSFRQETSGFGRLDDMFLQKIPCLYAEEFAAQPHLVFLSPNGVVCVSTEKARNCFAVLVFEAKGYTRMQIPALQMEGQKDFVMAVLNWISLNVFQSAEIWLVEDDKEIKQQLLK